MNKSTLVVIVIIISVLFTGFVLNVVKAFTECDYESPYKCEVVRVLGITIPIIGGVVGYMSFDNENKEGENN